MKDTLSAIVAAVVWAACLLISNALFFTLLMAASTADSAESVTFVGARVDGSPGYVALGLTLNQDGTATAVHRGIEAALRWAPSPKGLTVWEGDQAVDFELGYGQNGARLFAAYGDNAVALAQTEGSVFWIAGDDILMPDGAVLVGANKDGVETGVAMVVDSNGDYAVGRWSDEGDHFLVVPQ